MLDTLMAQDWVVYRKLCLEHTKAVVEFLTRYAQRLALTESRLLDYQDYRD